LTLTGQRFDIGGSIMVSLTNRVTLKVVEVTPSSSTGTSVTITVPVVESGLYFVRVRSDPIG